MALGDGDAGGGDRFEEYFAGDSGQAAGIEGRGEYGFAEDGEQVGGCTLADTTVFVEEDDFVVAALAGLFVPGEIVGPRSDFRTSELAGAVPGVGFESQAGVGTPADEIFGERDEVVGAGEARCIPGTAGVADDGDTEGRVFRMIGGDEAEEAGAEVFGGRRHGDVHALGIAHHAAPVAFVGEEDSVCDMEGGEDPPTIEQADLSGREKAFGGVAHLFVVEQAAMHALIVAALS